MALSKQYTFSQVETILRVLVDEIAPDKVQTLTIRDYINLSVNDVAEMLNGSSAPDYGTVVTGSVSNNQLAITGIDYDKVIKVVDATNGLVPSKPDFAFENLSNITSYQNSVFHFQFGENLFFFKGTNIPSYGTISVYYYRQPTPVVTGSDYLDIRDKYIPLVLAKAKNYIYEQVGKQAPEALTALIENKTNEIRQLNMQENAIIRDRQKPAQ